MKKLYIILYVMVLIVLSSFVSAVCFTCEDGLYAVYNFEQTSGNLTDQIGNNDSLNINVTNQSATGKRGGGWKFEHDNTDWVDLPGSLIHGQDPFSWICWVNFETINDSHVYLWYGEEGINDNIIIIKTTGYAVTHTTSVTSKSQTWTAPLFETDSWTMIGYNYDGTRIHQHVNGTIRNSTLTNTGTMNSPVSFTFGSENGHVDRPLDGILDECYFWNRNLTNTELIQLWDNSHGAFYPFFDTPLDNCSNFTTTTLNVSFVDFDTENPLDVDFKYSIDYVYDNTNRNYSNSGTGSDFSLCSSDGVDITGDLFIEYINNSILYTHYVDDIVLTSTPQIITLRISSGTTDITATVYDQTNNLFEGVYINYLKWDVDTNNYELMGTGKTNVEGKAILPLVQDTELYKFMLYYPYDTLRQTTVPTYITGTTLLFQISTGEDVATDFHQTMDVDTRLVFSNITDRFTWTYSDINSVITQACLTAYKITAGGFNETVDYDCLTTTSGVINSDVTRENGTTYCANADVTISGEDWLMDSLCYTYPSKDSNPAQFMGLLIAFIMTIAFAFAFKYSVELGIIAMPLPLLFCCIMGIVDIATPVVVGIEIAAIVLAIILNRVID